jgi:ceramide glucosyltransferase
VSYFLAAVAIAALLYQVTAVIAALRHMRGRAPAAEFQPGVSILKPIRGLDPHFYEAIRSHATQDYPEFEILFGVRDPADPAIREIERLAAEFPALSIRWIHVTRQEPNAKVGVLAELEMQAQYSVLLVNDSDIIVPSGYLRGVVAPLEDPAVGLVTCLYRADSQYWPGRWEAMGIATDFAPSVLVARLAGMSGFGLGSTLAFRREQLRQIGGFASIAGYLADDYQLGRRIAEQGFRVELSNVAVETKLSGKTWSDVWRHQVRWHRTIRVSRPGGYLGMPIAQGSLWALLAATQGLWGLAILLLAARMAAGLLIGVGILRCRLVARYFPLIPFRDLWGFGVWLAALFGNTVEWRDTRLRLTPDGRIVDVEQ